MAWTYVGGTGISQTGPGSITHGLTILAGDLVQVVLNRNSANASVMSMTADAGGAWTSPVEELGNNTNRILIAHKTANGTEPASYAYDTGINQVASISVDVWRPSGAFATDVAPTAQTNTPGSALYLVPSIPVASDALAINVVTIDGAPNFDGTVDNSFTYHQATPTAQSSAIASRTVAGGGATGITTFGRTSNEQSRTYAFSFVETGGADTTAPVLSSPQANSITSTSVTPAVTTDEGNGTIYARVYPDGGAPGGGTAADQIIDGTGATPVASASPIVVGAAGVINFPAITGLTAGTAYQVFYAQEDAAGNRSNAAGFPFATTVGTRTVALTGANSTELRDSTSALVSQTSVSWEWYDNVAATSGNPTDSGTVDIVSGEATITLTNSSRLNGEFGQLLLRDPVSNETRPRYYLPVTVV